MSTWIVEVECRNPIRTRLVGSVQALSEEQAVVLAEKRANEVLGNKGEVWRSLKVYIANNT